MKVINSSTKFTSLEDLYNHRELLRTFTWRDYKIRYAQTTLGFLWAFIQPIISISILSLVFGSFLQINISETPQIIYTACGLLSWTYFNYVTQSSGSSIIVAQEMIKKIYFPRIIIPISKAIIGLIDLGINLFLLVLLMVYFNQPYSPNIIFLPIIMLLNILFSIGIGIILSAINTRFRDFQYVVPFVVQLSLFLTPIAYPADFVVNHLPFWVESIYFLNPLAGLAEAFRWSILGSQTLNPLVFISLFVAILTFALSFKIFERIEKQMADIL